MYINILCNLFCQNISYIFNSLMSRFRIRNPHICVVKQHTSYKYIIDSLTSIFHKFTYLCGSNCLLLYCGKDCSPASPPSSICINYNLFLTAKIVHELKWWFFMILIYILSGDAVLLWQVERWHTICQEYSCLTGALKRLSFAEFFCNRLKL